MKFGKNPGISRREFVKAAGSGLIATTAGLVVPGHAFSQLQKKYNILLIVTDQERYMPESELPAGYRLPGHEKLSSRGTVFENHQIASCVCTPSRSVMYTGQHIQNNDMFDNTNFPWSNDLSTDISTVGDMLRRQGYYTAYKGKWHLTDEFETANDLHMPKRILSEEMEEYGFADYYGIGDMIAHTEGGFLHDGVIASMTRSWLRGKASNLRVDQEANLHGKDLSTVLSDPDSASFDAIRTGALFNYNMLAYLDSDFLLNISTFLREGGNPSEIPGKGWRPNLAKRGAIRSVFDGRYKLNRYFSPQEHHLPRSIEALFASNDIELFDLETDPKEMNNLALDRQKNGELLFAMNEKLNVLIESEVGEDIGQMLPGGADANWILDPSIGHLRM